jgi:S1-C subfamily serine protease
MKRCAIVLGFFLAGINVNALRADPADSVVKVTAFIRFPDPMRPWEKSKPVEGFGSGVYIGNKRILTNAHVVTYASELYVQWSPGGEKIEAKIEAQSVDLDLAVLTTADEKFFDKRKPLPRAKEWPKIKDSVIAYGFPRGGTGLSVTKGEVSRINSFSYGSEGHGLQIQVSTPVNPGNSGGPAVVGDKMIGLVYRGLLDAQNIGYIIPNEEIEHFLGNIKDGRFMGKPRVNTLTRFQTLENDALRRMMRVNDAVKGVLIVNAAPDSPLKNYDIVTKIGDFSIDNQGNVQLEQNLSVFFMYLVPRFAQKDTVAVTIRRDGKSMQVKLPVQYEDAALIKRYRGEPLDYFILGPLVFVPAMAEDSRDFYERLNYYSPDSPIMLRRSDYTRFPGEQVVVISNQFRHKITKGYTDHTGKALKSVNETPIKSMRHLVETIRDSRSEFLKLEFVDRASAIMVFDRAEIENATEHILDDIGISAPRRGSRELMAVWKAKKSP